MGINVKNAFDLLSDKEMKLTTGGQGGGTRRCWCCGSGPNEFFDAESQADAESKCGGCAGCFEPSGDSSDW